MDLLLDSSFLIQIANLPSSEFKNIGELLDRYDFVVLESIIAELRSIERRAGNKRSKEALRALEYAKSLKRVAYNEGENVDDVIMKYAKSTGSAVATMDKELRKRLSAIGVQVVFRGRSRLIVQGV